MNFEERYVKLNTAQKKAVDTVDGPVMVIAGPGTGKTELLALRAANILKKTDTLPENILCLTFTDNGAAAMRERLAGVIGKDAYKVAVYTFHSFGSEVINQYGEFFYQGALFRPADEISRYEIINEIFDTLPHGNILNKKMNGEYSYLNEAMQVISELKRSGMTSDELLAVLEANNSTIEKADQILAPVFEDRIGKQTAPKLSGILQKIKQAGTVVDIPSIGNLATILADSLESALTESQDTSSTKPITAWRNSWFKKNEDGKFEMKSKSRQIKLATISSMYNQYLTIMQERQLFDFDDMILRVVHAMEIFNELRFNLQERYQYIMVDEFQDTNMAQMRILNNLASSEVHGDSPNILVVGDDDQAIYSFQGAEISNILDFKSNYPKAELIALTENYRSGKNILDHTRSLITQGNSRLESSIEELDKKLKSMVKESVGTVDLLEFETASSEKHMLVEKIKLAISSGVTPNEIAVLTRKHKSIEEILPYLTSAKIPVQYDRRDDALKLKPIVLIETIARMLIAVSNNKHDQANELIPEILAHPAFNIEPKALWQLSLKAYKERINWLEAMNDNKEFESVQNWIVQTANMVPNTPLEQMLDVIVGKNVDKHSQQSPVYEYFFSAKLLKQSPHEYINHLQALKAIRTRLREYNPNNELSLKDFVQFITLYKKIGKGITTTRHEASSEQAIHVMTAHSSKGLEFDTVFVVDAIESVWGEGARSKVSQIGYPENLRLSPAGDNFDERLRLFYVACTRAKNRLNISYSTSNNNGKATEPVSFILDENWKPKKESVKHNKQELQESIEMQWYKKLTEMSGTLKDILQPELKNYRLSVTHLNNFLDVTRGGPQNFLMQNLLHFPQAMGPEAAYGSAVHKALQQAHTHLVANNKKQPIEDVIKNFETALKLQRLGKKDLSKFLQKGSDDLMSFLSVMYTSFNKNQKPEVNFRSQGVLVGDAQLAGALDLIEINEKAIKVVDYKTGKPSKAWVGKTDYEKIKLYKYQQQLMFYKLLVEKSRDYSKYRVGESLIQYIEPTQSGEIQSLAIGYNQEELNRLEDLIKAVWKKITTLDLPDTTKYSQNLKGILEFEQDLIDGNA